VPTLCRFHLRLVCGLSCTWSASAVDLVPDQHLAARAQGYADRHFDTSTLDPEDGFDGAEAFAFMEFTLLGAIDLHRVPVLSYARPVLQGDAWQMTVSIATATGPHNDLLTLDRFTGLCQGGTWAGATRTSVGGFGRVRCHLQMELGAGGQYVMRARHQAGFLKGGAREERHSAEDECRQTLQSAFEKLRQSCPGRFSAVFDLTIATETFINEAGPRRGMEQECIVATVPLVDEPGRH
jgi:hypothetical protein